MLNFWRYCRIIIDMKNTSRKPYIYKVTNFETGRYYIGSQCSGKKIGVNYFTSSTNKAFKDGFKTYGEEKYEITIIKEFTDPKECVRAENYIIRNYMQLKDGLCLNRFYCCNNKKIFSRLGTHPKAWNKGIPCSEEHKKKISGVMQGQPARNKGIPISEKTKQKISASLQGHLSPNRIKISIEGEVFNSLVDASKYYNVSKTSIRRWAKTKKHNAFYIEKCPKI